MVLEARTLQKVVEGVAILIKTAPWIYSGGVGLEIMAVTWCNEAPFCSAGTMQRDMHQFG